MKTNLLLNSAAASALILLFSGTATAAPCGNIGYTGCCEGTIAKYCSSGSLSTKDCKTFSSTPKCGWDSTKGFYTCTTSEAVDPNGKYPRECSKLPDGGIPDPDKGTKYDTGTKKDTGGTTSDGGQACGQITSQGCCDGETVKYCYKNTLNTKSCTSNPKCGWSTTSKFYTCGTTGLADPAGTYPIKCPTGSSDLGSQDTGGSKTDTGSSVVDTGSSQKDTSAKTDSTVKPKDGKDDDGCSMAGGSASLGGLLFALLGLGILGMRRRRR